LAEELIERFSLEALTNNLYNTESRYRHLKGMADEWDFFNMVYKIVKVMRPEINYAQIYPRYLRTRLEAGNKEIVSNEPSVGVFKPTITYRIVRKQPSSGASFFDSPVSVKPKALEDINVSGVGIVTVKVQNFDILTQFEIWTEKNKELQEIAKWFEWTMHTYLPIFKQNGITEILYWEAQQPRTEIYRMEKIHSYIISYAIRVQSLFFDISKIIEKITISLYKNISIKGG